ncbi:MAG: hypothetical protein HY329_01520 [Chloroflexi bacterium]|nr:hypothetical protein [Chloroflexota bacterium]
MADTYSRLLEHIARNHLASLDMKQAELQAPAARDSAAVPEPEDTVRSELGRALPNAVAFRSGLVHAFRRRTVAPGALVLDSADPEQDQIAGALIGVLVRARLATAETEELGGERYLYRVNVDWNKLADTAAEAGIDLQAALRRDSE